ncbi:MAG: Uma2 family endonuclease [Gemmataceae bacterium]
MASAAKQPMTAEELIRLPSNGIRHELVRGMLMSRAPVSFQHGKIVIRLGGMLDRFVADAGVGEVVGSDVGFYLERDPDTVRAPDIAFVFNARIPSQQDKTKYIDGPPDFAIEVLSPSDSMKAIEEKAEAFLEAGSKLVWVVNPRSRRVWVYQPNRKPLAMKGDDVLDAGEVIPGFRISIRDIFG